VLPWLVRDQEAESIIGSNNWAVDGAHSESGAAIVANDMHLSIGVPIIWYRASMVFPDKLEPSTKQRITGVTPKAYADARRQRSRRLGIHQ
jgi:penicillin amidase